MRYDQRGLAVSTDSDVVIEVIDRFMSDFMGVRDGAAAILCTPWLGPFRTEKGGSES
jgi:hypothetical protein